MYRTHWISYNGLVSPTKHRVTQGYYRICWRWGTIGQIPWRHWLTCMRPREAIRSGMMGSLNYTVNNLVTQSFFEIKEKLQFNVIHGLPLLGSGWLRVKCHTTEPKPRHYCPSIKRKGSSNWPDDKRKVWNSLWLWKQSHWLKDCKLLKQTLGEIWPWAETGIIKMDALSCFYSLSTNRPWLLYFWISLNLKIIFWHFVSPSVWNLDEQNSEIVRSFFHPVIPSWQQSQHPSANTFLDIVWCSSTGAKGSACTWIRNYTDNSLLQCDHQWR